MPIASVTEVIEVTGYRLWRGVLREANVAPTAASSSCHSPKRSLVICTPPEARGSILRDCNHLWRVGPPHGETGASKGSLCRYNMLYSLLKASPLRARERGPQPTAWKVPSANFALKRSEKGRRSLRCSLTEHLNGTFRPIFGLPTPPKSMLRVLLLSLFGQLQRRKSRKFAWTSPMRQGFLCRASAVSRPTYIRNR
jgi:hypothetical protein